jgi:hypothetical protein
MSSAVFMLAFSASLSKSTCGKPRRASSRSSRVLPAATFWSRACSLNQWTIFARARDVVT